MSVLVASDESLLMYARICFKLLSAFVTAAFEVGPLIPGVSEFRLSPWLCCVPSGSRDLKIRMNGIPLALNVGRTAFVTASANHCCWPTLAVAVPGVTLLPAGWLRGVGTVPSPALVSAETIGGDSGTPAALPVESSMITVIG